MGPHELVVGYWRNTVSLHNKSTASIFNSALPMMHKLISFPKASTFLRNGTFIVQNQNNKNIKPSTPKNKNIL